MAQRQILRGGTLDEAIDALLAQMISLGLELAPISRPEVQRRLGLTSRATLVGDRGRRIESARIAQLKESGRDPDGARRRRSLEERIAHLQAENADLIKQRDQLYEALSAIAQNCLLKGLDVENILTPLRGR
ncbi:hypothetical protein EJ576_10220 [Pseudomonas sp. C 49-2]|uniref:hypothetical protein n=1 Tax=unclassified Pseudomonas TaxID=196821 RepID=UPI000F83CD44|nr:MULTISPECIES: hypothetical protein [unclassified Pseudomonas]RTY00675.1 hypothetical protein EJ576_10220 [Pseudomonas sp. C 49-2]UQS16343.1 hypothetical protein JJN09_05630 [Pseudomonas sp. HS6]WPN95251.1 hypothetical protein SC319_13045 [Pseudomonas sp. MUP56]WPO00779.1 hypothetical protein SC318_13045 [Pseudomonas sp. MUP55]